MPSNRSLHISSKENKVKRRSKITKSLFQHIIVVKHQTFLLLTYEFN